MSIVSSIFRDYDIRGEYPVELNEGMVASIARAYVACTKARHIAVGMDMRTHSPALQKALVQSLVTAGVTVEDIGMVSTDGLYFAAWFYKLDGGIMVTASHMPKQFNGLKLLDQRYLPIAKGMGMEQLAELSQHNPTTTTLSVKEGKVHHKDIWKDYVKFVRSFVHVKKLRHFSIVVDAGNGMGWAMAERVFDGLKQHITVLNGEPDGTFPHHVPNPSLPENRAELSALVRSQKADIGILWDADCDRTYFLDERGKYINGDLVTALLAKSLLKKHPGAGVVDDIRGSHAVHDVVTQLGGIVYTERVGHSFIQARMRKEYALFGGEMTGHYYFQQNADAENGFVAALLMLDLMTNEKKPLSQIVSDLGSYVLSDEINAEVSDPKAIFQKLAEHFHDARSTDFLDGITLEYPDWHCNVRKSANEPVLRINVEAKTQALMEQKRDEVLSLLR